MENGQEWKSWKGNALVEVDLTLFLCSQPNFIIAYIIIQEKSKQLSKITKSFLTEERKI